MIYMYIELIRMFTSDSYNEGIDRLVTHNMYEWHVISRGCSYDYLHQFMHYWLICWSGKCYNLIGLTLHHSWLGRGLQSCKGTPESKYGVSFVGVQYHLGEHISASGLTIGIPRCIILYGCRPCWYAHSFSSHLLLEWVDLDVDLR
jgi:hypothetical protein